MRKRNQVVPAFMALLMLSLHAGDDAAALKPQQYKSPYRISYSFPLHELIGDIIDGTRGDPKEESSVRFDHWYTDDIQKRYGAWGTPAKLFPPPDGIDTRTAKWKRERVLAAALHYEGISYQHHHIPNWNPPGDWPWKKVSRGHNEKGLDCSNFTSFVYNIALGIKLNSDVKLQADLSEAIGPGLGVTTILQRIQKPATFAECSTCFNTGDLLFIHGAKSEEITHVVIWVGSAGQSPQNEPLILDSTGPEHKDSNGNDIPDGVRIRPFSVNSWYYHNLSHDLRIVQDN